MKKINVKEYLVSGLNNGSLIAGTYQKKGEITARVGVISEEIVTIMANGLQETKNIVTADENGNPGWVVTGVNGEQYIVKDSVFRSKYEKIEGTEDKYQPVWKPITATQIHEDVCFVAPWGEEMNILAGGYLVFNETFDDVYGIQEEEFNLTYKKV